ncbi:MAG: exo-alpha-sialidase [Tannerella sp.]|jgi:predicted neuraminidase|nr:exo-alpha-sialidase [Tannerella sp.]
MIRKNLFAAWILCLLTIPHSAPAQDEVPRYFVFGDRRPFEQCHASTLTRLDDGNYLVAWFGGTAESNDDVGIWLSRGKADRWSEPAEIAKVRNDAHWNPVLFRDREGIVYLFFKVGKKIDRWETWLVTSSDGGKTWSAPTELVKGDRGGRGPVRNKPVILSDGTWLAGASVENSRRRKWDIFTDRSADRGQTWEATPFIALDRAHFEGEGVIQPTLWESTPGQVHLLARSTNGKIYRSDSNDYGRTWSALYDTGLPNPNSGIDLVRLSDGTLALVYNPDGRNWGPRNMLKVAVSHDNGRTWQDKLTLEQEPEKDDAGNELEYSYPAIVCSDHTVALTYTWRRRRIVFREIPEAFFK